MAKMWAGVTAGKTDSLADDFNSSIRFDSRMARQDITGSIAHAAMLAAKGIISEADCEALTEGLAGILEDLESGKLTIDESAEDIHMFVEQVLTERIGDTGKKLHTARSAIFSMCSPILRKRTPKPSCRAIRICSGPSR